jgi:positive regulator of sigma E activity/YHS domain-containing protein
MSEETGVVAVINEDGSARVVTERKDACNDCGASGCCTALDSKSSRMVVRALNKAGAGVGDTVSLSLGTGSVYQSAILLYFLPVITLFAGAVTGTSLHQSVGMSETIAAVVFSGIGLAVGFGFTAMISRNPRVIEKMTPVITRILIPCKEQDESPLAVDPVCEMVVEPALAAASYEYDHRTYYFCNISCRDAFAENPGKHLKRLQSR